MKKPALVWLLACLWQGGNAQLITITDKLSGEPLELVTIIPADSAGIAMTNAAGVADISTLKGSSSLTLSLTGYERVTTTYDALALAGAAQMEESGIALEQVVVSATRWRQQASEVPRHIVGLSPADVTLHNPQTAADLLNATGQVFVQKSQQGGGSPMIRGFAANRLLIAVDGVRMNTAIFRGGNLQNIISLDPLSTQSIEVLFGPGSVIYGSDAIGGVISFATLQPQFGTGGEPFTKGGTTLRYSSANHEKTGHVDINVGWKNWAMLTGFSHNDYGDLRMGAHGPKDYLRPFYVQRIDSTDHVVASDDPLVQRPSGYSQHHLIQKFRYAPGSNWNITAAFHLSETSPYSRYDRHIRYRNGLPRYAEWSYGPQRWIMAHLAASHANTAWYDQATFRLAHQFFEESRIDRNLHAAERFVKTEKVHAYSVNADFVKALVSNQKFTYGLEAIYNTVASEGLVQNITTGTQSVGPSRYPQSGWWSLAAYATYQQRLGNLLLVHAGGRYNAFGLNATFDTTFYPFPFSTAHIRNGSLTGSLGVVLTPGEKLTLSTHLSTGFRSPNVDDAGKVFDSGAGAVVVPNPGLRAEYAYNIEVGAAKVFGSFLKFDATGFYTLLTDAMVRRNFMLNGLDSVLYNGELSRVQAIQNAAGATVYGFQAGLELKLPAGFSVSTRYNVQAGREKLDNGTLSPLRHAAPAYGVSSLSYTYQGLVLSLQAAYSSGVSFARLPEEERGKAEIYATDAVGQPYSPGWYTLNLKMVKKLNDLFTVSGGIENITDRRYRPYSSGMAGAGRNFVVSLKVHFDNKGKE